MSNPSRAVSSGSGEPVAAATVGRTSSDVRNSSFTTPFGRDFGQRTMQGTRMPPFEHLGLPPTQRSVIGQPVAAVVGEEDHQRIVRLAHLLDPVENLADRRVHVGDARLVRGQVPLTPAFWLGIHVHVLRHRLGLAADLFVEVGRPVRCVERHVEEPGFIPVFIKKPQRLALEQVRAIGALVLLGQPVSATHRRNAVTFVVK